MRCGVLIIPGWDRKRLVICREASLSAMLAPNQQIGLVKGPEGCKTKNGAFTFICAASAVKISHSESLYQGSFQRNGRSVIWYVFCRA